MRLTAKSKLFSKVEPVSTRIVDHVLDNGRSI
jgi:hypothetical protein